MSNTALLEPRIHTTDNCSVSFFDPKKPQKPIDYSNIAVLSQYQKKQLLQPEYLSISERKCYDVNPDDIDFIQKYFNGLDDYLVRYFADKYVDLFTKQGRQEANTFIRQRMGGTLRERVTQVMRNYSHLPTVNKVARLYEDKNEPVEDENPGQMSFNFQHSYKAIKRDKLLPSLSDEELREMAFTLAMVTKQFYLSLSQKAESELEEDDNVLVAYERVAEFVQHFGITPERKKKNQTVESSIQDISKMISDKWWLNKLTKVSKLMREQLARAMGQVSDLASPYCSFDCVRAHQNQQDKNWEFIQNCVIKNEETEEILELKDMVLKSMSNKQLRRMELMTRMRGIEDLAQELGLSGLFLTLTAPSKYHSVHNSKSRKGYFNEKWNYSTPRQTQKYLNKIWQRMRAKLGRDGLRWFGVRVAEPHHDGTPHWHMLLWCQPEDKAAIEKIFIDYATKEDKHELMKSGEFNHDPRCKIVPIDPEKGSATGYIAKYISKNIDGYKMDDLKSDESDRSVKENARHVTAWASRWGIRQFQFFGGAPITTYRELRRLANIDRATFTDYVYSLDRNKLMTLFGNTFTTEHPESFVGARFDIKNMTDDHLKNLLIKNYKVETRDAEEQVINAMVSADSGDVGGYNSAQGGMFVKRKDLLITNEYEIFPYASEHGEDIRKIKGIRALGEVILTRVKQWTIKKKSEVVGLSGDEIAPWSSVNNCTQSVIDKLRTPKNKIQQDGSKYSQLVDFTGDEVEFLMQGKRVLRDDGRLFKLEQRTQEQYELRELRPYRHKPTLEEVCDEFGFLDEPQNDTSPPEKGQQIRNEQGEIIGTWADNGTGTPEKHYQPDYRNELDLDFNQWELI